MKKLYTISILMMVMLLVAGCSTGGYPLTQEESDAIAQYSAHLLLKYSKIQYDDKLLDQREYEDALITPEPTATPTPKPSATPVPTEEPTQAPDVPDDDITPTPTPVEEKPDDNDTGSTGSDYMSDLKEIFGDSFEVSYVKHYVNESFSENAFMTLSAPEGKNLCIVTLNIKNVSDKVQRIKADNLKVLYMLYGGNKLLDTAELSLLSNDIQFLDDDIKAGDSLETVILFYINKDASDLKLRFKSTETNKIFDMSFNK